MKSNNQSPLVVICEIGNRYSKVKYVEDLMFHYSKSYDKMELETYLSWNHKVSKFMIGKQARLQQLKKKSSQFVFFNFIELLGNNNLEQKNLDFLSEKYSANARSDDKNEIYFEINNKRYSISSLFERYLATLLRNHVPANQESVDKSLFLIYPDYFNKDPSKLLALINIQQNITNQEKYNSKYQNSYLINEQLASVFGYEEKLDENINMILLVNIGAENMTLSIAKIDSNRSVQIINTKLYQKCGGNYFDEQIVSLFKKNTLNATLEKYGMSKLNKESRAHIIHQYEKIRKKLSYKNKVQHTIFLKELQREVKVLLTREKFEKHCKNQYKKIEENFMNYIEEWQSDLKKTDAVLLSGGLCNDPKIKKMVKELKLRYSECFTKDNIFLFDAFPTFVVSQGVSRIAERIISQNLDGKIDICYINNQISNISSIVQTSTDELSSRFHEMINHMELLIKACPIITTPSANKYIISKELN